MLKVRGLYYENQREQLGPLDLTVEKGQIVGIVGKNGSGKSLLLELISQPGLKYDGNVIINHYNAKNEEQKAIQQIGFAAVSQRLEPYLTGIEYLELVGINYGLSHKNRLDTALDLADQFEVKKELFTLLEQVGESTRQKVRLISVFMTALPVILLDEPYLFLDQIGKEALTSLIKKASQAGSSILISTNELQIVEEYANRIVVLEEGEIVAEGTLTELHHLTRVKHKNLGEIIKELTR